MSESSVVGVSEAGPVCCVLLFAADKTVTRTFRTNPTEETAEITAVPPLRAWSVPSASTEMISGAELEKAMLRSAVVFSGI